MSTNPYKINKKEWDKEKVVEYLCDEIANSSKGVESILNSAEYDMPSRRTVMAWISHYEDLDHKYARAKDLQVEFLVEECMEIADGSENDIVTINKGDEEYQQVNHENIQRSKLRIDMRKWQAGKLKPKKYGDKQQVQHSGGLNSKVMLVPSCDNVDDWEQVAAAQQQESLNSQ